MIAQTTTYWKIRELEEKEDVNIYLLQGGQGAGKNGAMSLRLNERAEDEEIFRDTITIMTDTYDNLKDGAITDFEFVFKEWGLNFYDYYNKQNKTLTWYGKKIQFRYLADTKPDKGKGSRRGILYINEGNRVGWEAVKHYIARSQEVYIDFNPDFEFWAHKELLPKENCERIILTYKDNEMCPQSEVDYIESRRDNVEWFKVYGKGETGTYSERRVYQYQLVEDDAIPKTAKKLPSGMDFGQSPDPTCQVDLYLDGVDLYLHEIFCENNLLPEKLKGAERLSIVDRKDQLIMKIIKATFPMEKLTKEDEFYLGYENDKNTNYSADEILIRKEIARLKSWQIIGDSSGKTELLDLRKHGYNARGVKKKSNSQADGIKRLQSYNIKVTASSKNIINGMDSWLRKIDHNGEIVPEPQGHEPDTLVAPRYVMLAKALW